MFWGVVGCYRLWASYAVGGTQKQVVLEEFCALPCRRESLIDTGRNFLVHATCWTCAMLHQLFEPRKDQCFRLGLTLFSLLLLPFLRPMMVSLIEKAVVQPRNDSRKREQHIWYYVEAGGKKDTMRHAKGSHLFNKSHFSRFGPKWKFCSKKYPKCRINDFGGKIQTRERAPQHLWSSTMMMENNKKTNWKTTIIAVLFVIDDKEPCTI